MKSITKHFFLFSVLFALLTPKIPSLRTKKSTAHEIEESLAEEISEKEEIEYAVPSTNSTNSAEMTAEGWLKISSTEFKNLVRFPPIEIDGNKFYIKTDKRDFRINNIYDPKKKGGDSPKSRLDFYFRLVNNLIYYTVNKKDVNMLGSILISSMKEKTIFLPGQESEGLCFSVKDQENNEWDICADDKKTADNFMCKINKSLGKSCNDNKTYGNQNVNKTALETQTYQPVIVVPIPAKECNINWDYSLKGNEWECGCQEGIEQSPIDIPEITNIIESPVTPYFTFKALEAKSILTTIDGELKTHEHMKIKYFKNAIRILHYDIGKIVTLDGSVYIGEEIVFHTPAEHKINGKIFDMEMQVIYYGRSKGDIAKQVVLSFLFEQRPGIYNKFLEDLDIFNLPNEATPERDLQNDIYIPKIFYNVDENMELTTKPFSFYTYQGSLTSPPCTEETIHYVVADPIPIGSVVIQLFKEALKKENSSENGILANVRKTQPLNGRKVFLFDKDKYSTSLNIPKFEENHHHDGHFERLKRQRTMFQWVNDSSPSRYPGAMVVPDAEINKILRESMNDHHH